MCKGKKQGGMADRQRGEGDHDDDRTTVALLWCPSDRLTCGKTIVSAHPPLSLPGLGK